VGDLHVLTCNNRRVGITTLHSAVPHEVLVGKFAAIAVAGTFTAPPPIPTQASGISSSV